MELVILTTAFALSMDAFTVSVSKGMTIQKMSKYLALKISLFFGLFQGFMPFLGWLLGISFEKYIVAIDHWIALILLSYLGFRMIREFLEEKNASKKDSINNQATHITTNEILVLAVATSIDALAVGISFVFADINIMHASTTIAVITFIMCIIGCAIGSKVGNIFKGYANLLGGVILIGIGISIFDEHTGFISNIIGII